MPVLTCAKNSTAMPASAGVAFCFSAVTRKVAAKSGPDPPKKQKRRPWTAGGVKVCASPGGYPTRHIARRSATEVSSSTQVPTGFDGFLLKKDRPCRKDFD